MHRIRFCGEILAVTVFLQQFMTAGSNFELRRNFQDGIVRTTYTDEAHTPKIALRQIFGRLSLKENLCKLAADAGLFSVEVVAMLGDTAAAVEESIKTLVPADALHGGHRWLVSCL